MRGRKVTLGAGRAMLLVIACVGLPGSAVSAEDRECWRGTRSEVWIYRNRHQTSKSTYAGTFTSESACQAAVSKDAGKVVRSESAGFEIRYEPGRCERCADADTPASSSPSSPSNDGAGESTEINKEIVDWYLDVLKPINTESPLRSESLLLSIASLFPPGSVGAYAFSTAGTVVSARDVAKAYIDLATHTSQYSLQRAIDLVGSIDEEGATNPQRADPHSPLVAALSALNIQPVDYAKFMEASGEYLRSQGSGDDRAAERDRVESALVTSAVMRLEQGGASGVARAAVLLVAAASQARSQADVEVLRAVTEEELLPRLREPERARIEKSWSNIGAEWDRPPVEANTQPNLTGVWRCTWRWRGAGGQGEDAVEVRLEQQGSHITWLQDVFCGNGRTDKFAMSGQITGPECRFEYNGNALCSPYVTSYELWCTARVIEPQRIEGHGEARSGSHPYQATTAYEMTMVRVK